MGTFSRSASLEKMHFLSLSTPMTSPRITVTFFCRRRIPRGGGPMWPPDKATAETGDDLRGQLREFRRACASEPWRRLIRRIPRRRLRYVVAPYLPQFSSVDLKPELPIGRRLSFRT